MNSIISFSVKDLGLGILWIMLIVLIIYIIRVLIKVHSTVKQVSKIIEDNNENINKILNETPAIANSVNRISGEIAHGMEAFRGSVDNVAEVSESVTENLVENNTIIDKMGSILHTFSMGKSLYDKYFGPEETDEDSENKK